MPFSEEFFTFGVEKHHKERDEFANKGPLVWLEYKQFVDKLLPYHTKEHLRLWRIHDDLYDFTGFKHPGGDSFLELSVNTDITELFESSHPNITKVSEYLNKYKVSFPINGKASIHPRYTEKFTFQSNGFYCTLRKRICERLNSLPVASYWESTSFVHDTFLLCFLFSMILSISPVVQSSFLSYLFVCIAGAFLACLANTSHNFFHLKLNWRRFTFDLSCFSSYEWQITHVYSHHTYSNTLLDAEVWGFEPLLHFMPLSLKNNGSSVFYAAKTFSLILLIFPVVMVSAVSVCCLYFVVFG
jgi:hypothetical protein